MKKTYKEKYFELKKEKNYLQFILNQKCIDYNNLKIEFTDFKNDLKVRQDKENKNFFIFSIVGISLLTIFAIITMFLG